MLGSPCSRNLLCALRAWLIRMAAALQCTRRSFIFARPALSLIHTQKRQEALCCALSIAGMAVPSVPCTAAHGSIACSQNHELEVPVTSAHIALPCSSWHPTSLSELVG